MANVKIYNEVCKGCSLCVAACPKKILKISETESNNSGYFIAECIDQSSCIACAMCATMCPDVAIEISKSEVAK